MATKKKRQNDFPQLSAKVEHTSIVQLALLPEQEDKFLAWDVKLEEFERMLTEAVTDGLVFTITANTEYGGFSCSTRKAYEGFDNSGQMFYSNAPTPFEALSLALFKVFTVGSSKDWSSLETRKRSAYS